MRLSTLLMLAFISGSVAGCQSIITVPFGGGVMASPTNMTGEVWYVRNTTFIFPVSSEVFYCDGSGVCKKASIR